MPVSLFNRDENTIDTRLLCPESREYLTGLNGFSLPDSLDLEDLCFQINENSNPEAMRLIEAHWHKHHYISWYMLSKNPNIFTYDYAQMKETKNRLHEELIRNMFHPRNMDKFEGWGIECEWF